MYEVEAKISITTKEYSALKKRIETEGECLGIRRNADTYYGILVESIARVRNRDGQHTFDLKLRRNEKGVESNIELEWKLRSPRQWKALLSKLSIEASIRKSKVSEVYKYNGCTIELNKISKLGCFLEIERMVDQKEELLAAKKGVIATFQKLGYTQRQFENRTYLELLKNV